MARAHHGGSASGNAETEGFAHLPANRDRKQHGGQEAVTGTNRAFRLDGGSWQEKRSGGAGKDRAFMAHGHGDMGGLSGSNDFECRMGDFVGIAEFEPGQLPQLADARLHEKDAAFIEAALKSRDRK